MHALTSAALAATILSLGLIWPPAPPAAEVLDAPLSPAIRELPAPGDLSTMGDIQYLEVFGVGVAATSGVPRRKWRHAAGVLAQYLDNDEDGIADNPDVVRAMNAQKRPALMCMFANEADLIRTLREYEDVLDGYHWQDLFAGETHPEGSSIQRGFDATLEEVLHLVSTAGHVRVYPEVFGEEIGTEIADAMDIARGGQFIRVPNRYPEEAWYHYDDRTCDYGCQITEYFYWALTSLLGAQQYPGRPQEISNEWEPYSPGLVRSIDVAVYEIMTRPEYRLPRVLPDGLYQH